MKTVLIAAAAVCAALATTSQAPQPASAERHLRNIRQLTFGGENAEAYFSSDGTRLIFQSTRDNYPCDQIYTIKPDGTDLRRVSTGKRLPHLDRDRPFTLDFYVKRCSGA